MNVEAQAIKVPDRPAGLPAGALRRHRRARARGRRRPPRAARRRPRRAEAAHRALLHRRAAQLRHQQLGDHQAAHRRRPARLRLLRAHPRHRRRHARGARSAATGTPSARAIADEWENRKRLAPGVTTPAIDDLIARATAAGATAAKVCGAGGGGCLFCYGPPDRRATRSARRSPAGGARLLDFTFERHGLARG